MKGVIEATNYDGGAEITVSLAAVDAGFDLAGAKAGEQYVNAASASTGEMTR